MPSPWPAPKRIRGGLVFRCRLATRLCVSQQVAPEEGGQPTHPTHRVHSPPDELRTTVDPGKFERAGGESRQPPGPPAGAPLHRPAANREPHPVSSSAPVQVRAGEPPGPAGAPPSGEVHASPSRAIAHNGLRTRRYSPSASSSSSPRRTSSRSHDLTLLDGRTARVPVSRTISGSSLQMSSCRVKCSRPFRRQNRSIARRTESIQRTVRTSVGRIAYQLRVARAATPWFVLPASGASRRCASMPSSKRSGPPSSTPSP